MSRLTVILLELLRPRYLKFLCFISCVTAASISLGSLLFFFSYCGQCVSKFAVILLALLRPEYVEVDCYASWVTAYYFEFCVSSNKVTVEMVIFNSTVDYLFSTFFFRPFAFFFVLHFLAPYICLLPDILYWNTVITVPLQFFSRTVTEPSAVIVKVSDKQLCQ